MEINKRYGDKHGPSRLEFSDGIKVIPVDEFEKMVENGRKLVIIDNYVLDLGEWSGFHPGGKFTIEKTVGRDISKFFYGGYQLINEPNGYKPYRHSV